jgi:cupin 2 domain-containing protein
MMKNLFDLSAFAETGREQFETLLETGGFHLERIASFGQATPEGEWYDQAETEWVAVLRGTATLVYDDGTSVALQAGDHLVIPPHRRHRVAATGGDCLWLALHYPDSH